MADESDSSDGGNSEEDNEEESSSESEDENLQPPKRPLRANNYYIQLNFDRATAELVVDGRDAKSSDVFTKLSKEWMRLNSTDRQPYLEKAEKDKQRYHKELQIYRARYALSQGDPSKRPPKRKLEPRKLWYPRRPRSAMLLFMRQQYPAKQEQKRNSSRRQLLNELRDDWVNMNEEQREPYYQMHQEELKRYQTELAEYHQRRLDKLNAAREEERRRLEKEEARRKRWFPNCPLQ